MNTPVTCVSMGRGGSNEYPHVFLWAEGSLMNTHNMSFYGQRQF